MMRLFKVTLVGPGGSRDVRVPSLTGVQAGDAAVALARPGEAIGAIEEVKDEAAPAFDAPPALSQAAELAPVTPGFAAAPPPSNGGAA